MQPVCLYGTQQHQGRRGEGAGFYAGLYRSGQPSLSPTPSRWRGPWWLHVATASILICVSQYLLGLPQQRLREVLEESGRRDVGRGQATGRFAVTNDAATSSILSGAMIGALSGRLEGILDDDDLDDAVEYLLRLLGVPAGEARAIAHRPLPPLP